MPSLWYRLGKSASKRGFQPAPFRDSVVVNDFSLAPFCDRHNPRVIWLVSLPSLINVDGVKVVADRDITIQYVKCMYSLGKIRMVTRVENSRCVERMDLKVAHTRKHFTIYSHDRSSV